MDERSKCTKVLRNNIWPQRKKEAIIEQCIENSSVIHATIGSSVVTLIQKLKSKSKSQITLIEFNPKFDQKIRSNVS